MPIDPKDLGKISEGARRRSQQDVSFRDDLHYLRASSCDRLRVGEALRSLSRDRLRVGEALRSHSRNPDQVADAQSPLVDLFVWRPRRQRSFEGNGSILNPGVSLPTKAEACSGALG